MHVSSLAAAVAAAPVEKEVVVAVVSKSAGNPRFEDNGLELGLLPGPVGILVDPAVSHPSRDMRTWFFFSFGTRNREGITLIDELLIDLNEVLGGSARGWGYDRVCV